MKRTLSRIAAAVVGLQAVLLVLGGGQWARADYLKDAKTLYQQGHYFKAARYAFAAKEEDPSMQGEAYSWVTLGLIRTGLYNSASYFFIRTLQTGDRNAIRRVLTATQELQIRVGGDLLRKYLIRHTKYEDYDLVNRSAYLYALGKDALLAGDPDRAIGYFNGVSPESPIWPFVLQLRGSAQAIKGRNMDALEDFRACQKLAPKYAQAKDSESPRAIRERREVEDLQARCLAGEGRTFYQMERFEDADYVYDKIQKTSFVWPDILFEQAWNAFARQEFNRTLGKLVSYKSPALSFVFNPEVDVLRAQAFLALCQYADANEVINEFHGRYQKTGEAVKKVVETNRDNLAAFYEVGKGALRGSLYTDDGVSRVANRFVRGPYFQNLVQAEMDVIAEQGAIQKFDSFQPGVRHDMGKGFPGFLDQVLKWRVRSIQALGGGFVKNSLIDYHSELIADFEKIAFIKLEMLKRAKDELLYKKKFVGERALGNVKPERRDYQYFWTFNGEFWNDELGDYIFNLESKCQTEQKGGA